MSTDEQVKKELTSLVEEFESLIKLTKKASDIVPFGSQYQLWYSRATKLVELLGQDRLEEFRSYYRIDPKRKNYTGGTYVIQDYVNGMGARTDHYDKPLWDIHNAVGVRLINQVQILKSLSSRLSSVLADVRGHLLAELEDEELKVAQNYCQ